MTGQTRHIRGALYGSRLIEQPHVVPLVRACLDFIEGPAPVLVEVGFDHGRRLHSMARLNPDWRFLGLEVRKRRVEEAIERAERDGIDNLHVWRMDARTVLAGVLNENSVDLIDVFFPTPWWNPALREKRLLVDQFFVEDAVRVLRPGGLLRVATDVEEYAEHIETVLDASDLEVLTASDQHRPLPSCGQLSRREWRCEQDDLRVYRFTASKNGDAVSFA